MPLQSVLLSSDQSVLGVLPNVLKSAGVAVDVYRSPDKLFPVISRYCVGTLIVDCDDQACAERMLKQVRDNPANQKAVVVLIAGANMPLKTVFAMGASLVLQKPFSRDRLAAGVRALRNLIVCEKRRSARHPLQAPLVINHSRGTIRATTMNLSEGGLGFQSSVLPEEGTTVEASFVLPGTDIRIHGSCNIAWNDATGFRGGLKFGDISNSASLRQWLNDRFEEDRVSSARSATISYKD